MFLCCFHHVTYLTVVACGFHLVIYFISFSSCCCLLLSLSLLSVFVLLGLSHYFHLVISFSSYYVLICHFYLVMSFISSLTCSKFYAIFIWLHCLVMSFKWFSSYYILKLVLSFTAFFILLHRFHVVTFYYLLLLLLSVTFVIRDLH